LEFSALSRAMINGQTSWRYAHRVFLFSRLLAIMLM
jgi:hypothetical protein